jgi:subtilisin family serine protease
MKRFSIFIFAFFIVLTGLIACEQSSSTSAKTEKSELEMDHSQMGHSEMEHEESEDPIPNTKNMTEVYQQEISNSISYWHKQNVKGTNIKVAVLDTGIDLQNKDLNYIKGINFTGGTKDIFADDNGHGTKISGIIGARENDYNLLGVSPNVDLYIGKVADQNGNVQVENLVDGIEWAIQQDVDIINISLEFTEDDKELLNVIKKAHNNNIIIVASSGNINHPGDVHTAYPGAYQEVISVGMLNVDGMIYSDEFKQKDVDVFAPGEDIYSTYFNDKMTLDTGVSFATAYTSGYTALLLQSYKELNIIYDLNMVIRDLKKHLESKLQ